MLFLLALLATLNGTVDANPIETYTDVAALLNKHGIVYLHIAEVDWDDVPDSPVFFKRALLEGYQGVLIYAGRDEVVTVKTVLPDGKVLHFQCYRNFLVERVFS